MAFSRRVVVIGAGAGGLTTALLLSARGIGVTVVDTAEAPGGKMRLVDGIDAGPTVLTMRWVLDEVFAEIDEKVDDHLTLRPLEILARHAWTDGSQLDLWADNARTEEAIGSFAGAGAACGYRAFCAQAGRTFRAMDKSYIRDDCPSPISVAMASGLSALTIASPFSTLWDALRGHFTDPRLRQLFARYATYCGCSPFEAPATLMLIAHVEQRGVYAVDGGMHHVARTLMRLAAERGAAFRYGQTVARFDERGVHLASGEMLPTDAVVVTADMAALRKGLFGPEAAGAVSGGAGTRSLSALTWAMHARADGFALVRHNVFFADDYRREFADIATGRLPAAPTVYVCAQDRDDAALPPPGDSERLLVLVNAPAVGDTSPPPAEEIARCQASMSDLLTRCGLTLTPLRSSLSGPAEFAALFPATGGALYGPAQRGWRDSFARPTARSKRAGIYLAGGSTHPGPGVPMAMQSGRFAAAAVLSDFDSIARSRTVAMPGGMSTP